MRVLVDALSAREGGGVTYIRQILPALAASGRLEIHVLLSPRYQQALIDDLPAGVVAVPADVDAEPLLRRWWYAQTHVRRIVRERRIDVLFSVVELGALFPGCPHVVLARNLSFHAPLRSVPAGRPRRRLLAYRLTRQPLAVATLLRATRVVFVSESFRDLLTATLLISPRRARVVHHGVSPAFSPAPSALAPPPTDASPSAPEISPASTESARPSTETSPSAADIPPSAPEISPSSTDASPSATERSPSATENGGEGEGIVRPREEREAETPPHVLTVATLVAHKNHETLLDAFAALVRGGEHARLELRLAGAFEDAAVHEALRRRAAELGIGERVRFLGRVAYGELPALYRGAAAFVLPSRMETFGQPLVEAMASGIPVVASDLPICREVCGAAALYFPPDDADALAAALRDLLPPGELRTVHVRAGLERAASFTWLIAATRLEAVLEEAARGGAGRA